MEVKWTNTSLPSGLMMKPKPFLVSNHLTLPVGMAVLPQCAVAPPRPRRWPACDMPAGPQAELRFPPAGSRCRYLYQNAGALQLFFGFLRQGSERAAEAKPDRQPGETRRAQPAPTTRLALHRLGKIDRCFGGNRTPILRRFGWERRAARRGACP